MRNLMVATASWLALTLLVSSAAAQERELRAPRIGLVLSGGGAKGAAHVGVIKVLEELGVHADVVSGTSMGSIVGGLYASGMGGRELEQAVGSIDWEHIFNDDPPRAERSFRRKQDDSEVLIRYRLGIKDGGVRLPKGVIIGQKLGLALRRLAARTPEQADFDQLPRPFRAVATDLETGDAVVIGSGSLARAMHASMSVPGVFPPVEFAGKVLVDGGLANNLPIDVARSLGAERLIVVNLASELRTRETLVSAVEIAEQSVSLMIERETRRQLATLGPGDILIEPALGDLGGSDFDRTREAIDIGEAAAREAVERLASLRAEPSRSANGAAPAAGPSTLASAAKIIDSIRIDNDTPLDDAILAAKLTVRAGETLDRDQLERDISQIYGLGYFETVDYHLEPLPGGGNELVIHARERAIGLGSLRFGLTLESDFESNSAFNLIGVYERLGVNALGGEWRSVLAFGEDVVVGAEFYQPLDIGQRWFVDSAAAYQESSIGVFDEGRRVAEFRVKRAVVGFDLGRAFVNCCELRGGLRFGVGESRIETGASGLEGGSFQVGSVVVGAGYDTLDNPRFPRSGAALGATYTNSLEGLGASEDAEQVELTGVVARTAGEHTVLLGGQLGVDLGNNEEVENLFSLGGLFNLSGFARDEVSGENKAFASVIYYYRISGFGDVDLAVPLYLGSSFEYGGTYDDLGDFGGADDIAAGSLFMGADTPLGPFYLALGAAEAGHRSLYLFLGQNF